MVRFGICVAVLFTAGMTSDPAQAQTGMWTAPPGFPSGTNFGYGRVSSRRGSYLLPVPQMAVAPPALAAPTVTFRPVMPVAAAYGPGCSPCHAPCQIPAMTRSVYYAPAWPTCCGY